MNATSKAAIYSLVIIAMACVAQSPTEAQTQPSTPSSTIAPATRLVGTWEGKGRTAEGIGSTVSFAPNGLVLISPGAMLDYNTKLEGDDLVSVEGATVPQPVRIHAASDALTYQSGTGQPQRWLRLGKAIPGQPAFVGTWAPDPSAPISAPDAKGKGKKVTKTDVETEQAMRGNMRLAIASDGKVRVRMVLGNNGGTYVVQGNKLIMQVAGGVTVATFRFEGDTLYLQEKGEAEGVFVRAE